MKAGRRKPQKLNSQHFIAIIPLEKLLESIEIRKFEKRRILKDPQPENSIHKSYNVQVKPTMLVMNTFGLKLVLLFSLSYI